MWLRVMCKFTNCDFVVSTLRGSNALNAPDCTASCCVFAKSPSTLIDVGQQELYADYGFKLFRSARRQEAISYCDTDVMEVLLLFPRNLHPRKTSALTQGQQQQ
ncbi:hypothetical protein DD237_001900 [Peronospora effusa]|uniref:Uncharacterized protein n=1 Tax=Peronospora effusa TaxID=542832 RepID=A0A3R7YDW7_9STRA|nr:hypothetical protein DD237_001900 [Peronospora effusa]